MSNQVQRIPVTFTGRVHASKLLQRANGAISSWTQQGIATHLTIDLCNCCGLVMSAEIPVVTGRHDATPTVCKMLSIKSLLACVTLFFDCPASCTDVLWLVSERLGRTCQRLDMPVVDADTCARIRDGNNKSNDANRESAQTRFDLPDANLVAALRKFQTRLIHPTITRTYSDRCVPASACVSTAVRKCRTTHHIVTFVGSTSVRNQVVKPPTVLHVSRLCGDSDAT